MLGQNQERRKKSHGEMFLSLFVSFKNKYDVYNCAASLCCIVHSARK